MSSQPVAPRNFDLVKDLGASVALNYKSPNVVEELRAAAPELAHVFDTIGNTSSSETASRAVQTPGRLCTVRPGKANTEKVIDGVELTDVLVWTAFLKVHSYGKFYWPVSFQNFYGIPVDGSLIHSRQASEDDHKLATELFARLPELLASGKVRPNDVLSLQGLDSVPQGFEMYRQGKISAQKIVYDL